MNNDNRRSWGCSPRVLLHLKQIYGLTIAWGKAVILNMTKIKNIFEPYLTQELYSKVYFHHLAENRLTAEIQKVASPFHFISEHPAAILAILPRSSRSCRDTRDPAAIFRDSPRDHRNSCCLAINRHCFMNALCDRRSQGKG